MCCPKKIIKSAVRRNRLKRIVREYLRLQHLTDKNLFIKITKDPGDEDGVVLRKDLDGFMALRENV